MRMQDAREELDLTADSALVELASRTGATDFTGYEELRLDSVAVLQLLKGGVCVKECSKGDQVDVVLARTPFYAEAGGQVGDIGTLEVRMVAPLLLSCGVFCSLHVQQTEHAVFGIFWFVS